MGTGGTTSNRRDKAEWAGSVGRCRSRRRHTDNQPERGVEQLERCNYLFVLVTLSLSLCRVSGGILTNPSGCRLPHSSLLIPLFTTLSSAFCRIFLLCARLLHDFRTMTAPAECKLHFVVVADVVVDCCCFCVPLLPISFGSRVD